MAHAGLKEVITHCGERCVGNASGVANGDALGVLRAGRRAARPVVAAEQGEGGQRAQPTRTSHACD